MRSSPTMFERARRQVPASHPCRRSEASGDKTVSSRASPDQERRVARSASPNPIARTVWVLLAALFVSATAVFLPLSACGGAHPTTRPLIVVGADGLEWRLVLQFAQQGVLPNITRMMSEG